MKKHLSRLRWHPREKTGSILWRWVGRLTQLPRRFGEPLQPLAAARPKRRRTRAVQGASRIFGESSNLRQLLECGPAIAEPLWILCRLNAEQTSSRAGNPLTLRE